MIRSRCSTDSLAKRYRLLVLIGAFFLLFQGVSISETRSTDYYCSFEVVGYYPDYWQIPIPAIRYDRLTDVVFFSIYPNPDGTLNTSQVDLSRQTTFVQAARANGIHVLICIGGWGLSEHFSAVAADPSLRSGFILALNQYCLDYDFDGVVLDWEPVTLPADQNNYTLLITELHSILSEHGKTLHVAVSALGSEFSPTCIDDIDRLHIMAYDMASDPALHHSTYDQAVAAVSHWQTFGFHPQQIILGLPFYGRDLQWAFRAYKDIIRDYSPPPEIDEIDGIHFNGVSTIGHKTHYMVTNHYRGVMFWELTGDTSDDTSLLSAISDEILLHYPPDFNCDTSIDANDLDHLAANWLKSGCQSENAWCDASDMDQSGRVNLEDFAIFAEHWLTN